MDELSEELQVQLASIVARLINLHTALVSLNGLLETYYTYLFIKRRNKQRRISENDQQVIREISLRRIIFDFDLACVENTRMDRRSFHKLCDILKTVGILSSTKNMCVEEVVAMFLHICAHHAKNRIIKRQFWGVVRLSVGTLLLYWTLSFFTMRYYSRNQSLCLKIQPTTDGSGLRYLLILVERFLYYFVIYKSTVLIIFFILELSRCFRWNIY